MQDVQDAKKSTETPSQSPPVTASTTPDYAVGSNATPTFTPDPVRTPEGPPVTTVNTPVQVTTTVTTTPTVPTTPVQPLHFTLITLEPTSSTNSLDQSTANLKVTREHMLAAQDMFRNANTVTRPEKALVLGFMAGSRNNPCPHLGDILTIKLSEDRENVLQPDETYLTMLVETHFQMNYATGEWKRIKKYRHIENVNSDKVGSNNQTAPTG